MEKPSLKIIDKMENILNLVSDSSRIKILFSLLDIDKCHNKCKEDCLSCPNRIEKSVSEIVSEVELSQSLVSHQLKLLKDNRLVASRRDGKNVYYYLMDHHVKLLLSVVLEHILEEMSHD